MKIEYSAFKIFSGDGFAFHTTKIPIEWCKNKLTELTSEQETEQMISKWFNLNYIEYPGKNSVKLSEVGKQYFDNHYFNEQVFEIVDFAINKLKATKNGLNSINTRHRNHRIQLKAESVLEEYDLIEYKVPHDKALSMVQLKENGYKAIDAGGIENYINQVQKNNIHNLPSILPQIHIEHNYGNAVVQDSLINNLQSSLKEEKEKRIKYLIEVYKIAKEELPTSPSSVYFGLSKYRKFNFTTREYTNNDKERGGYIIGEELGLTQQEVDTIVIHYSNIGYMSSTLGLCQFNIEQAGINYLENYSDTINQPSYTFMNTHITNTGDGNVVNTGDNSTINTYLTINKNEEKKLFQNLKSIGVSDDDVIELKPILETEKPDHNTQLGSKTKNWIGKQCTKFIDGTGKVGVGVAVKLITNWILSYHGLSAIQ